MLLPQFSLPRLWLSVSFTVAVCAGMASGPARAIDIVGEGPANVTGIYDRFIVGTYAGAPVPNPTFIGSAFDLSGIGWLSSNSNQSITLVSSQYIVGASHFFPSTGATLQFYGTDHQLHSATVGAVHTLTYTGTSGPQASDLTLGRLTTALPSAVTPMPIFYAGATDVSNASSFVPYAGVSLFNYGQTARMGTNNLDGFSEFHFVAGGPQTNIGLIYTQGTTAGETLLESGDSGSPTIGYQGGTYGLIGTHSGIVPSQSLSVDAFVSYTEFVAEMNAFLSADGQSLTLAAVPEPAATLIGVALLGICGVWRRRRVREEIAGGEGTAD